MPFCFFVHIVIAIYTISYYIFCQKASLFTRYIIIMYFTFWFFCVKINYINRRGIEMDKKHALVLKKSINIATALLTVALGICLIVACLGIYKGGEGEYTRSAVETAFSKFAFVFYTWLAFVVIGGVCHFVIPTANEKLPGKRSGINKLKTNRKALLYTKLVLVALGLLLVVVGVCTGGMADVLAKAINICTECVGLG